MTVYSVNFGIGWASSGVEYAQLYRAQALRGKSQSLKFIFLDFINYENIQTLTNNLGFKDEEIIWLYQYFTDIKIAPTSVTIDEILGKQSSEYNHMESDGKTKKFFYDNRYIICYLKFENSDIVDRVEYVSRGKLLRRDYYSYVRFSSEYFAPEEEQAILFKRDFYNEDGSIAFSEYLNENESLFEFKDQMIYSKPQLVGYLFEKLKLTNEDMIILDRSTDIAQPVLENKNDAKLGIVVHAEHFNEPISNDDYILWNNHYEYVFMNVDEIDFYITATDIQNKLLQSQFQKYLNITPKIYTIPVGNLKSLVYSEHRKPYSIMTASRLANEKHVDWLLKAVIKAKQQIPQITFDIYGEGGQKQLLKRLIVENDASTYISLLGHVDLENTYKNYELFLSGSTSEGFGLTLMEAVGSGLGIIGFDVNYGNPTFINHQNNGYLISLDTNEVSEEEIINKIAESIMNYFKSDMKKIQNDSYRIAEDFKLEAIQNKWTQLIDEVQND
ncbi:accessory Sec system glycosyltransferase GtfA [Staphylococcus shinii]|uniref:accessory Sec system glycosyltransferase GtfA n=1 Tax=Staphylococcus shinii TaxID=2912228 RepID=UPI000D1E44E8|nr:accessory Sec system glycosyltransferase GtfA [Staphylococcus shinii]PTI67290.1 accessory Sec system glycosyltransferase GtfA [Staphylococcus shinii]